MVAEKTVTQANLNSEWMTPNQLANELGLTLRQQEKLRAKRKDIAGVIKPLPYTKIGRNIFYNREQINEWLLENQVDNKWFNGELKCQK